MPPFVILIKSPFITIPLDLILLNSFFILQLFSIVFSFILIFFFFFNLSQINFIFSVPLIQKSMICFWLPLVNLSNWTHFLLSIGTNARRRTIICRTESLLNVELWLDWRGEFLIITDLWCCITCSTLSSFSFCRISIFLNFLFFT